MPKHLCVYLWFFGFMKSAPQAMTRLLARHPRKGHQTFEFNDHALQKSPQNIRRRSKWLSSHMLGCPGCAWSSTLPSFGFLARRKKSGDHGSEIVCPSVLGKISIRKSGCQCPSTLHLECERFPPTCVTTGDACSRFLQIFFHVCIISLQASCDFALQFM